MWKQKPPLIKQETFVKHQVSMARFPTKIQPSQTNSLFPRFPTLPSLWLAYFLARKYTIDKRKGLFIGYMILVKSN